MHDDLGVAGGLKYRAVILERGTQMFRVRYITVLCEADRAFAITRRYGLDVLAQIVAAVETHVTHAYLAFERFYRAHVEHVVDVAVILYARESVIVVDYDAAAQMSPVLEREQTVTKISSHISSAKVEHAYDAALSSHVIAEIHILSCFVYDHYIISADDCQESIFPNIPPQAA